MVSDSLANVTKILNTQYVHHKIQIGSNSNIIGHESFFFPWFFEVKNSIILIEVAAFQTFQLCYALCQKWVRKKEGNFFVEKISNCGLIFQS